MSTRILIVDDEPAVTNLLAYNFRRAHYQVDIAADGATALRLAQQNSPDLILLDLMLPEIDGLDVCREIRKSNDVPIIMITARGEELDRVVGLELGADDYVAKPFSVRELMARVKAVLRRTQKQKATTPDAEIISGPYGLILDPASRTAAVEDQTIDLTRLEFDLLYMLTLNTGNVLSRERLLEDVWGYDYIGDTRSVDSAIKRLRGKLSIGNPKVEWIETVRGIGYRLKR